MNELFPNLDPEKNVLVIGAAGMDIVGRLDRELASGTSNPAHIRTSFGGVARNVAENLARLGQPVRLITVVGQDVTGNEILEHINAAGVDATHSLRSQQYPTGYYIGILNESGQLQVAIDDMRLLEELTNQYLKDRIDLFKTSSMVFLDANLPVKTLRTAASLAKRAKIPICIDPTSSSLAERVKPILGNVFLITPNCHEASVLTDQAAFDVSERDSAFEAARALVNLGVRIALVTLAEFGVVYATPETTGYIPAIRTRIKDSTGAGDAMTAGLLFGLLNDIELDEAIRLGVSAASITLRHAGSVYPELSLEGLYEQLLI